MQLLIRNRSKPLFIANMKKYFFILSIIWICISCTHTNTQIDLGIYTQINLDDKDDEVSIHDLFSEIDIIPLETNDSSLFSWAKSFFIQNETIYIWDQKLEDILLFRTDGKFISKLNKKGNGPEEYPTIHYFNLNRFTGNIELLVGEEIKVYDKTATKFLYQITRPDLVIHAFSNVTPDIYAFHFMANNNKGLRLYSQKEDKIISETWDLPPALNCTAFLISNPFYVYNDTLRIVQSYDGQIYTAISEPPFMVLKHAWDMGKYNFDVNTVEKDKDWKYYIDFFMKNSMNQAFGFTSNFENDTYYITAFRFHNEDKFLFYNKKTKEKKIFHQYKEGGRLVAEYIDNEYIYAIGSYENYSIGLTLDMLDKKNREKLMSLTEESNPFLVRFKFKQYKSE